MYKYHYRPGYGSKNFLIEIYSGPERKEFFGDLLSVLKEINIQIEEINDLWMNDEFMLEFNSGIGSFLISKDIYDLVFIMADNNPCCIETIYTLLLKDHRFEKTDVDLDAYK